MPDRNDPLPDPPCTKRPRSKDQQDASRLNGARSRGPVTEEGKSRSAGNALSHGLFAARYVTLPGESDDEFRGMRDRVAVDLGSKGEAEGTLAHTVATAVWREQRLDAVERALWDLEREASPLDDAEGRAKLDLLSRLQQRNQALQMRARAELRRRREERGAAAEERTTALTEQRNTIEWAQELERTRMKAELAEAEARLAALEAQLAVGATEPAPATAPSAAPVDRRPRIVRNEPESAECATPAMACAEPGGAGPPPELFTPEEAERAMAMLEAAARRQPPAWPVEEEDGSREPVVARVKAKLAAAPESGMRAALGG